MNAKRLIIGAAAVLALAPLAAAQDDSAALFADAASEAAAPAAASEAAAPAASAALTITVSGSHEADYHAPADPSHQDYDTEMKAPAFRNELGVEIKGGDLKVVSRWSVDLVQSRSTASTAATGYSEGQNGSWDSLARLRPLENYLSWSPTGTRLKAAFGYQFYAWGVADKVNPTDNLNPRDYASSVIDPEKVPLLAADVTWYATDALSAQAVFAPFEQGDTWPTDYAAAATESLKAYHVPVEYSILSADAKNFVAGGRLSHRSGAGDYSVSYLYDFDPYYSLSDTVVPAVTNYLERRRIQRFGADAKTTLGAYGLWAEACWSMTDRDAGDDLVRRSKLDYVLGTDFSYGPNDAYYVNLQYVGSWIPGWDKDAAGVAHLTNSLGTETEGMLQGAALNLKWELLDAKFTPELRALYVMPFDYDDSSMTRYGSLVLAPKLDFMPKDSFHIQLGAELAYSWYQEDGSDSIKLLTSGDRIGVYTASNNVFIKVIYKWNYEVSK